MAKKLAIKVEDVHKTFRIPLDGGTGLKQRIVHFTKHQKGYREFSPLNGVSFEVEEGEFFGIVGRNGSGKSTLLKTIAGIYEVDSGSVQVNGKLVPFIELGVGFNPELTGRENVFLNGALLGFSRAEMEDMYDEIVDFAELHDFMEERLKNYSSGMQVRLAFSIAIRAKGDVLLLDEVLAVGDAAFQKKCYEYFGTLKDQKKTVILVTHSMSAVEQFCSRGVLLNDGKIAAVGSSSEIANAYENMFIKDDKKKTAKNEEKVEDYSSVADVTTSLIQNNNPTTDIVAGVPFRVRIKIAPKMDIPSINLVLNIKNYRNDVLCATGTEQFNKNLGFVKGQNIEIDVDIENIFTNGNYSINIGIDKVNKHSRTLVYKKQGAALFVVNGIKYHKESLTHPTVDMQFNTRGEGSE